MIETLDSLGAAIRDRLKNAFVGTYILFWMAWNWRILVLLWKSKEPIESTINFIDSQHLKYWPSLIAPALCTAAYLVISPWVSHWIFLYQMTVAKRRIRAKQERDLFVLKGKTALVEQQAALDKIARRAESEAAAMQRQAEIARQEMKALQEKAEKEKEEAAIENMMNYTGSVYMVTARGARNGAYCPVCYDSDNKMVRVVATGQPRPGPQWFCRVCKNNFQ
jgi:hypothetical protein